MRSRTPPTVGSVCVFAVVDVYGQEDQSLVHDLNEDAVVPYSVSPHAGVVCGQTLPALARIVETFDVLEV